MSVINFFRKMEKETPPAGFYFKLYLTNGEDIIAIASYHRVTSPKGTREFLRINRISGKQRYIPLHEIAGWNFMHKTECVKWNGNKSRQQQY